MKKLYLILFISFPVILFGQSNYHEGYVVKNNGDTLKGYINYKDWAYSPVSVEFKTVKNDNDPQQFTPNTIKGFQITGLETYISYVGAVSLNKNIFPDLPSGLDTTTQFRAIFLRQLESGNHITLYYNNEVAKNRFFIAETNAAPVELKYYEYYGNSNSEEVFDNLYRGQLLLIINKFNNGNAKLRGKIEQVKFDEADLVSIADAVNNNIPANNNGGGQDKKQLSKVRLFIGAGINNTATKYDYSNSISHSTNSLGDESVNQNMASYSSATISPKINFGIDISVNPNVQRFIFRIELSYSYSNGSFNRPVTAVNNVVTNYNYAFTQNTLMLTPQIIYNIYNTNKLKFYIDAGPTVDLSSYSDKTTGANPTPLKLQGFWACYSFQAGAVFNKKFEIYYNYNSSASYSAYTDFSIANQSMCLGLKYYLNR